MIISRPLITVIFQEWIKPEEEKAPEEFLFGNKKEFISAKMLMNGQTKAENIQAFFARNLNKLGRDLMGPPVGKTVFCTIFV